MTFILLRFFASRYKVSLTWNSNPRPLNIRYNALQTEVVSLTQV